MANAVAVLFALALLFAPPAFAGTLEEMDRKTGRVPRDLADAISKVDARLVACFNYQQQLDRERAEQMLAYIKSLEGRIERLEADHR